MKKKIWLIPLTVILIAALAVAGYFVYMRIELNNAPEPGPIVIKYADELMETVKNQVKTELLGGLEVKVSHISETDEGKALHDKYLSLLSIEPVGESARDGRTAEQRFKLSYADLSYMPEGMNAELNAALTQAVSEAKRMSDIYTEDNNYKEEIVEKFYAEIFESHLNEAEKHILSEEINIKLEYSDKMWKISNGEELASKLAGPGGNTDFDAEAAEIREAAATELEFIPIHYKIEETALRAPLPDQSKFVTTTDPAEIDAIINSPEAQKLIGDRELLWNSGIERIPDTPIYCYFDETILSISWQQVEARAVGTYSEVIISDGSQLRRRIAGDAYEDANHMTTTEFAIDCNAVLTLGGDFYHHGRNCGIVVINREIYRFDPHTCDCCYITGDGDMLFSYRDQFETQEEAQAYVDENDILYSLCFGPVLIDEGEDVTPEQYQWGEIHDTYARSALGMLDEHHYLTLNINCQQPGYYYLATLRDAADAMVRAGCIKAYTLDGGQTATTVFNQELINPVQFGWEKPISDVIYFGTALPEE